MLRLTVCLTILIGSIILSCSKATGPSDDPIRQLTHDLLIGEWDGLMTVAIHPNTDSARIRDFWTHFTFGHSDYFGDSTYSYFHHDGEGNRWLYYSGTGFYVLDSLGLTLYDCSPYNAMIDWSLIPCDRPFDCQLHGDSLIMRTRPDPDHPEWTSYQSMTLVRVE